jgi:hypothetical protein
LYSGRNAAGRGEHAKVYTKDYAHHGDECLLTMTQKAVKEKTNKDGQDARGDPADTGRALVKEKTNKDGQDAQDKIILSILV